MRSLEDDLIVEPFIENALELTEKQIKSRASIIEGEDAIYGSMISLDKQTTIINIVVDPPQPNKEANLEETINYIINFIETAKENNPELDIRLLGNPYQEYISPKMVQAEASGN